LELAKELYYGDYDRNKWWKHFHMKNG
jgi:hypothetical protein